MNNQHVITNKDRRTHRNKKNFFSILTQSSHVENGYYVFLVTQRLIGGRTGGPRDRFG